MLSDEIKNKNSWILKAKLLILMIQSDLRSKLNVKKQQITKN